MGLLCSRSQRRFKILVNVCLDNIFWTTEHFVAKPGMVMQHHKPKCYTEKLVHCAECQGHSEGFYKQNMIIFVVSSKLLVGLQSDLFWQYSIINQCPVEKWDYCIQGQGHSEGVKIQCFSRWYLLNHQTFCFQTWHCDSGQWVGPLDLYWKEDAPTLHKSPSYGWNSWCQHSITG